MKIYTKTGDDGTTSLFGGSRVHKDDARIEAYGTIDELNSFVGNLYDSIEIIGIKEQLYQIQNKLFNVGSVLAIDPSKNIELPSVNEVDIEVLENLMDTMNEELPPLKNFTLPSGHDHVSKCHVCRTVCRRGERRIVALARHSEVDDILVKYINRLSDYFYVLSRFLGHKYGAKEVIWKN